MELNQNNCVGAYAAKAHFSELLSKVEAGEEITITKHGTPVAKMVPVKPTVTLAQRLEAIQRIKQLGMGLSLHGLKIRDLVNEGRR